MNIWYSRFYPADCRLAAVCFILLLTGACSTLKKPESSVDAPPTASTEKPVFGKVNFSHDVGPVGDVLRAFGEQQGGGFVLMSGLEERAVSAIQIKQDSYEDAMRKFAEAISCACVSNPWHYTILPADYTHLQELNIGDSLHERYRPLRAQAVFGAKTPLYVVFAALSANLNLTILADNYIAEARCGEIHLPDAPLEAILEAVLLSARIAPESLAVESTEQYIFFKDTKNESSASMQLSADNLTEAQQALLNRPASLVLPGVSDKTAESIFALEPVPLREALQPITDQLGVPLAVQKRLADVLINPCVFNEVPLSIVFDLILRQWPMPVAGWELRPDGVLIRVR